MAHIGVFSVDTGDKIGETMLLLFFVWDEDGVRLERALMDLETGLVGNPVAVSERRGRRMMISGHVMGNSEEK